MTVLKVIKIPKMLCKYMADLKLMKVQKLYRVAKSNRMKKTDRKLFYNEKNLKYFLKIKNIMHFFNLIFIIRVD
jgi:hypothetical protein